MPSSGKEWDEDPWDHWFRDRAEKKAVTPFTKERTFVAQKTASGYNMTTISAAVIQAIRDAVRDEVGNSVELAFQKIMDRLEELEAEITRER